MSTIRTPLLGVTMRLAAAPGVLMLVLMWTVVLPPANNLFMDDHLIYAMFLVILGPAIMNISALFG